MSTKPETVDDPPETKPPDKPKVGPKPAEPAAARVLRPVVVSFLNPVALGAGSPDSTEPIPAWTGNRQGLSRWVPTITDIGIRFDRSNGSYTLVTWANIRSYDCPAKESAS